MGIRENKELIRQLHEAGFPGDPERLDRYFAPSYTDHSVFKNLAGLKTAMKAFHSAYPSAAWKLEDIIAEGDKVAVRCDLRIPAGIGKMRSILSTSFYRVENNKIVETWGNSDPL
jgi:predicted SnoaL-like aldol condensation-catalyzing enzyme